MGRLYSQHSFWREEIDDDVDFIFFFKINIFYSLYGPPLINIQASKGGIFTIKLKSINYLGSLYVLVFQSYQPYMFEITHIKTTLAQLTEKVQQ